MIAVIQRVTKASVWIRDNMVSEINHGMLILLGIRRGDTMNQVKRLAQRCANLRIFEDSAGKFNLALPDVGGAALVVSQFTLLADTSRGRRPSFTDAEKPEQSKLLYNAFIQHMLGCGIPTEAGVFGEHMRVSLDNDGPVTVILEE
jgi:D-tyrosyl-tRNA(Tyr) deacylase